MIKDKFQNANLISVTEVFTRVLTNATKAHTQLERLIKDKSKLDSYAHTLSVILAKKPAARMMSDELIEEFKIPNFIQFICQPSSVKMCDLVRGLEIKEYNSLLGYATSKLNESIPEGGEPELLDSQQFNDMTNLMLVAVQRQGDSVSLTIVREPKVLNQDGHCVFIDGKFFSSNDRIAASCIINIHAQPLLKEEYYTDASKLMLKALDLELQ